MHPVLQSVNQQRNRIIAIAKRYGAENVRLFGSVVRNEAHDDSDVDFLVSFLPGATLFDQAGLIEELSTLLERDVDGVSAQSIVTLNPSPCRKRSHYENRLIFPLLHLANPIMPILNRLLRILITINHLNLHQWNIKCTPLPLHCNKHFIFTDIGRSHSHHLNFLIQQ